MQVRRFLFVLALGGCAELGLVEDSTSRSLGSPAHGSLVHPAKLPDEGPGFMTREVWKARNNRYGTDELVALVEGVAARLHQHMDTRLVVGDLSSKQGGGAYAFHRSHQSGRDCDLVYFMRDKDGKEVEADAMRVYDRQGKARDGTGTSIDIPKMWLAVKELVQAPEAPVQWIFMYEPIALLVLERGKELHESDELIARVRKILKQPGDSARHDDHFHVRVYCSPRDAGCVDIGPMEPRADWEAQWTALARLGARADRIDPRGWR